MQLLLVSSSSLYQLLCGVSSDILASLRACKACRTDGPVYIYISFNSKTTILLIYVYVVSVGTCQDLTSLVSIFDFILGVAFSYSPAS
jgi:hypothetical protein